MGRGELEEWGYVKYKKRNVSDLSHRVVPGQTIKGPEFYILR